MLYLEKHRISVSIQRLPKSNHALHGYQVYRQSPLYICDSSTKGFQRNWQSISRFCKLPHEATCPRAYFLLKNAVWAEAWKAGYYLKSLHQALSVSSSVQKVLSHRALDCVTFRRAPQSFSWPIAAYVQGKPCFVWRTKTNPVYNIPGAVLIWPCTDTWTP